MKTVHKPYQMLVGGALATLFLVVGILTLSDYGLNIDEPNHFMRGQAFFHYLRTGEETYDSLEGRRSLWQQDSQDGRYYLYKKETSHPPLNDILAAGTNYIFYQKLGIFGDLESYHLFEVVVSSLLVFLVFHIAASAYGLLPGIVAALSLALYPLFFGEAHFNIKDPLEATFYAYCLYFSYMAIEKSKPRYWIFAGITFGFAMGTKFNAVFAPFIVLVYLVYKYLLLCRKKKSVIVPAIDRGHIVPFLVGGILSLGIFIYSNPRLWADPWGRFVNEHIAYYQGIGTGSTNLQPAFVWYGINTYPALFALWSTPPNIIILALVGICSVFFRKTRTPLAVFALIWLIVPIARVSISSFSIYSGVRQIMEYIPALAVLSAAGAKTIVDITAHRFRSRFTAISEKKSKIILYALVFLSFILPASTMMRLHPFESIYLNSLVGGVHGAVEKKIPGAANTMGSVYLQGVEWLSQNAEEQAKFGLGFGHLPVIPSERLRGDIQAGPYFSANTMKGEYMMQMYYSLFPPSDALFYKVEYIDGILEPVHEVVADGVVILKIWKNSPEHVKEPFKHIERVHAQDIYRAKNSIMTIVLPKEMLLTKMEIYYDPQSCSLDIDKTTYRVASYMTDHTKILPSSDLFYMERMGQFDSDFKEMAPADEKLDYYFPGVVSRRIAITVDEHSRCLFDEERVVVYGAPRENK